MGDELGERLPRHPSRHHCVLVARPTRLDLPGWAASSGSPGSGGGRREPELARTSPPQIPHVGSRAEQHDIGVGLGHVGVLCSGQQERLALDRFDRVAVQLPRPVSWLGSDRSDLPDVSGGGASGNPALGAPA